MSRTWKDRPSKIRAQKPQRKDLRMLMYNITINKDATGWRSEENYDNNIVFSWYYMDKINDVDQYGNEIIYYSFYYILTHNAYSSIKNRKKAIQNTYHKPMRRDMSRRLMKATKIANNTQDYEDTQISPSYVNNRGNFGGGYID